MNVPEGAQLSEDGNYWWDGAEWQLVADGGGDESGGGVDLAGALAEQGIEIPAEAADPEYLRQMTDHVSSWYGDLDDTERTMVDVLTSEGGDHVLADPEVGLVDQNDPLIAAFANTDMSLGQSLDATNAALEQATS
ncbi:MAG TPA: hypothetical protein VNP92_11140 [Actinophytocola sp.]|nr:hypothetical protein [Actinophytocola sp.]